MAADPDAQGDATNSVEFIQGRLGSKFDEASAHALFRMYCVDGDNGQHLLPPDVRKLLLDVLEASGWPLVVPDESLEAVLNELCLNVESRGTVSWVEWKSFFVFLQDVPLHKLFQITTAYLERESLNSAYLITFTPVEPLAQEMFNRDLFIHKTHEILPATTRPFVYFLRSGEPLVLAIGSFETLMAPNSLETNILLPDADVAADVAEGLSYAVEIRQFDPATDIFPPIARAGGVTSRVARTIADTYLRVKRWDKATFGIVDKFGAALSKTKGTVSAVNESLRVEERVGVAAAVAATAVQVLDERHQITRRLSDTARNLEETYGFREKVSGVVETVSTNETVQTVTSTVSHVTSAVGQAVSDVSRETQQLVSEKQAAEAVEDDADGRPPPSAPPS